MDEELLTNGVSSQGQKDLKSMIQEAQEKVNKENNPGPKIRPPKKISLKKFLSERSQSFLNDNQRYQKIEMSDRNYIKNPNGWQSSKKQLTVNEK